MTDPAENLMRWIEEQQEAAYSRAATMLDLGNATQAWERLTGGAENASKREGLPTRFENPRFHRLLSSMSAGLQDAMGDIELDPRAVIATMPTGDVSARGLTDSFSGIPVIFLEQGLMEFLMDFAFTVAWALPPLGVRELFDDEAITGALANRRYVMPMAASGGFAGVLNGYVITGTPVGATGPGVPVPPHNQFAAIELHGLMLQFILAHELGHRANGDSTSTWEREYDADTFGMALSMGRLAQDTGSAAAALWGADLALACFTLLHKGMAFLAFRDEFSWVSKTHPDEISRSMTLRATIGSLERTAIPTSSVAKFRELLGMSDAILNKLWEFGSVQLAMSKQEGKAPSELWRQHIHASMGGEAR